MAVLLVPFLCCGGALVFSWLTGIFPGPVDMATFHGVIDQATEDRVCLTDPYRGQVCLDRGEIDLFSNRPDRPDAYALQVGDCIEYMAKKGYLRRQPVSMCSDAASGGLTGTTTRTTP